MSDAIDIKFDQHGDLILLVGPPEEAPKSFLVCSRSLGRISPVFERMLYGSFSEAKPVGEPGDWTVRLPSDDPEALVLLLRIAHCQFSQLPRAMSVDRIFELVKLTHYYDTTLVLVPWVDVWLKTLSDQATISSEVTPKVLWIAWELGRKELFETTAWHMLMEAPASVIAESQQVDDLLNQADILDRIAGVRNKTIEALLTIFRELVDKLLIVDEGPRWCHYATFLGPHRCESMILGSLTFCLTHVGLWPLPEAEDVEDSLVTLHEKLKNVVIHDIGRPSEKGAASHEECNPSHHLMDQIHSIMAGIPDPTSDSHRRHLDERSRKLYS